MTQTPPATDGVVLEIAELYYLLRTHHAVAVIGLEDEGLFPPPGAAADALIDEGFAKLQFHGWLRPAERPGRFALNPEIALLAAIVANPQFVLVTARALSATERAQANHYVGADLIAELTLTPARHIRLAFVQNKATLLQRVEDLLRPTPNPLPPARYSLPEPEFEAITALARGGAAAAALERLRGAGLSAEHAQSLTQALAAVTGDGTLFVMRTGAGEIFGGRKATVHEGPAGAWLTRREDSASTALSIETVQPGTVSGVVESYVQALVALLEPVA